MKRFWNIAILVIVVLSIIACSNILFAQEEDMRAKFESARADYQGKRQQFIEDNVEFTAEEGEAFWPLYKEYRGKSTEIGDRVVDAIFFYADSYQDLSDSEAQYLLGELLAIQKVRLDLKTEYVEKFKVILPPIELLRFFQLENKLDAILDAMLAENIPMKLRQTEPVSKE